MLKVSLLWTAARLLTLTMSLRCRCDLSTKPNYYSSRNPDNRGACLRANPGTWENLQVNMATESSVKISVWPEDGSNDPPEEATEAHRRHVAAARIS